MLASSGRNLNKTECSHILEKQCDDLGNSGKVNNTSDSLKPM